MDKITAAEAGIGDMIVHSPQCNQQNILSNAPWMVNAYILQTSKPLLVVQALCHIFVVNRHFKTC